MMMVIAQLTNLRATRLNPLKHMLKSSMAYLQSTSKNLASLYANQSLHSALVIS